MGQERNGGFLLSHRDVVISNCLCCCLKQVGCRVVMGENGGALMATYINGKMSLEISFLSF